MLGEMVVVLIQVRISSDLGTGGIHIPEQVKDIYGQVQVIIILHLEDLLTRGEDLGPIPTLPTLIFEFDYLKPLQTETLFKLIIFKQVFFTV